MAVAGHRYGLFCPVPAIVETRRTTLPIYRKLNICSTINYTYYFQLIVIPYPVFAPLCSLPRVPSSKFLDTNLSWQCASRPEVMYENSHSGPCLYRILTWALTSLRGCATTKTGQRFGGGTGLLPGLRRRRGAGTHSRQSIGVERYRWTDLGFWIAFFIPLAHAHSPSLRPRPAPSSPRQTDPARRS